MSNFERARAYLARMDPGISGQEGHNSTFAAACQLVEFGLNEEQAWELLCEFNSRCVPPWSEKELRHKLGDAFKKAKPDPQKAGREATRTMTTHKPTAPAPTAPGQPAEVKGPPAPMALPEPIDNGAIELLKAAFRPGEGVRICPARLNEEGREVPESEGLVLPVEEWIRRLEKHRGNVNGIWSQTLKAKGGKPGVPGAGIYISINPMRIGGSGDADVTSYRYTLVEFDGLQPEVQWSLYVAQRLPCVAIISSGGKSIHAWVRVDARDRKEYDERVALLHDAFRAYGVSPDPKNRNPSRFSRIPSCKRFGKEQQLLALEVPGACRTFTEWQQWNELRTLPPPSRFSYLLGVDTSNDPNCVIGFRDGKTLRYLCKGKSAWLLGPSGIGKSSLISEFAIGWALGKPVFGIAPAFGRNLRSLIVQAENDEYDLAEQVQGIASAHDISKDDPRLATIDDMVIYQQETRTVNEAFVRRLEGYINRDRPDIVWIDPLLSFAGIDVSKQDQVSSFLRTLLNPMLETTGAVLIGVHHTGKPKFAKDTKDWTAIDWAYSGLGSSELVNWARAVMLLRPMDLTRFELKLAKRGNRAGATHRNGEWTNSIWLQHAQGKIRWEQLDPPEEPASAELEEKPRKKTKTREFAERADLRPILLAIPDEGESARSLGDRLHKHAKKVRVSGEICEKSCRTKVLDHLSDMGKIIEDEASGKWMKGPNL